MPKRKIKTKTILLKLNEEDYNKIILQAGKYKTLTEIIEENIRGGYYSKFKTNEIINTSIPGNREVVNQLQKQEETKTDLEQLKQEFIKRRTTRKEGDSNA